MSETAVCRTSYFGDFYKKSGEYFSFNSCAESTLSGRECGVDLQIRRLRLVGVTTANPFRGPHFLHAWTNANHRSRWNATGLTSVSSLLDFDRLDLFENAVQPFLYDNGANCIAEHAYGGRLQTHWFPIEIRDRLFTIHRTKLLPLLIAQRLQTSTEMLPMTSSSERPFDTATSAASFATIGAIAGRPTRQKAAASTCQS